MKSVKLVSLAVLCMTGSAALADTGALIDRYGRGSQIAGGAIAVTSAASNVSAVNGRGMPANAGPDTQSVIAAERNADGVNGRA